MAFPRSAERGPIEAAFLARAGVLALAAFPRSAERGPIEASYDALSAGLTFEFPRSAERGPIEASTFFHTVMHKLRFHVRLSVAPLKQFPESPESLRYRWFPRSAERGPIEACWRPCRRDVWRRVSTFG